MHAPHKLRLPSEAARVCRMLRFAATYGFSIDRTLAKTAERLSMGRLLSPPSNLMQSGHRAPLNSTAVALDPSAGPALTCDPRRPPLKVVGSLETSLVGKNAAWEEARNELIVDCFPGVITTCACSSARATAVQFDSLSQQSSHDVS
jgi:hypothetical protein